MYLKLLIFPWHCRKFLLVLQSHREGTRYKMREAVTSRASECEQKKSMASAVVSSDKGVVCIVRHVPKTKLEHYVTSAVYCNGRGKKKANEREIESRKEV